MSDVMPVFQVVDEVTDAASDAVGTTHGALGAIPAVLGAAPEQVGDAGEAVAVGLLPHLDAVTGLHLTAGVGPILTGLDEATSNLLGAIPTYAEGLLDATVDQAEVTLDTVVEHTVGSAGLGPVLAEVAESIDLLAHVVSEISDELPSRLSNLSNIAIVGADGIFANLPETLDATQEAGPAIANEAIQVASLASAEVTASVGPLGVTTDIVTTVVTEGPAAVSQTADAVVASGTELGYVVGADLNGAVTDLGVATGGVVGSAQSLATTVPAATKSMTGEVLSDAAGSTLPSAIDTVTFGAGSLVEDPTEIAAGLFGDADGITGGVSAIVTDTLDGIGLGLG